MLRSAGLAPVGEMTDGLRVPVALRAPRLEAR